MRVEDRMLRSSDSDLLEGGVEMPTEYLLSYALAPERTLRRPLTVGLVDEHEGNERTSADLEYEINKTDTCVHQRPLSVRFMLSATL
jgi:hypothetical protein